MDQDERGEEQNAPDEEYSFLSEQVKKRPARRGRFFLCVLGIVGAAALFGAVAAAAFMFVTGLKAEARQEVVIPSDTISGDDGGADSLAASGYSFSENEEPLGRESGTAGSAALSETGTPAYGAEASSGSVSYGAEQGGASLEASGSLVPESTESTRELTAEEKQAAAIEAYSDYNDALIKLVKQFKKSMVEIYPGQSESYGSGEPGTGILIADDGQNLYFLLPREAADERGTCTIEFKDGTTCKAKLMASDKVTGFAALSVKHSAVEKDAREALGVAPLGNSYVTESGDTAVFIGEMWDTEDTFYPCRILSTSGSAPLPDRTYPIFATDLASEAGPEGIIINLKGELLGFVPPAFLEGGDENESGTASALPISAVKAIMEKLNNGEQPAYFGIISVPCSETQEETAGAGSGLYITDVLSDSPALHAGIRRADVLKEIDGVPITTLQRFHECVLEHEPGDTLKVKVMRLGSGGYVEVECGVTLEAL